jgi:hypothetical protein
MAHHCYASNHLACLNNGGTLFLFDHQYDDTCMSSIHQFIDALI